MRRSVLGCKVASWRRRKRKHQRRNPRPNAACTCLTLCGPMPHARLRENPQGFDPALGYKDVAAARNFLPTKYAAAPPTVHAAIA